VHFGGISPKNRPDAGFRSIFRPFAAVSFSGGCVPPATAFWFEPRIVTVLNLGNRCTRTNRAVEFDAAKAEGLKMKKLVLALTAVAAMTGSASAADLAARPYTKAPVAMAPVTNWTGCYVGGGGGGAYTKNDHNDYLTAAPNTPLGPNLSTGADGWFGTVQVGCDYQWNNFVVGVFADYDFMDVHGDVSTFGTFAPSAYGSQKQDYQWAAGGRVGYLVLPQLLTYVSGGYTQAHWKSTTLSSFGIGPTNTLPGATKGGWFIGTGDEYALSFLPGLFWKTEYRYSEFDRANVGITTFPGGLATGVSETQKFKEHSVRSELVYRFNWGGSVVAKY
jgi:outer membrane immunogenic protein